MGPPKQVVIVGGSIAGLLQGLQLKRQGSEVIILEQDPSKERDSHESGINLGPSVVALLEKYDATGRLGTIPSQYISVAWRKRLRVINRPWYHEMSNWGWLYNVLRANFDGLVSTAVPVSPEPIEGDGKVEYRSGQRVTGLSDDADKRRVTVQFTDVVTGVKDQLTADLVMGADGVHSVVRSLIGAEARKDYAGYIAWRGTVPERLVTKETIEYFSNRLNFCLLRGTYLISYLIPTEAGDLEPGKRLINWVWYFKVTGGSHEMARIFTDVNGRVRQNTVSQGLVNPEVWADQKAKYVDHFPTPFAEVVTMTPKPFVTKVGEAESSTASVYDGRVVLVGDALTSHRPHMGMASEQAARHCWQMDKVWRGETTQEQRDCEARLYARRFLLINRMIGLSGMEWLLTLLRTGISYTWVMFLHQIGRL
ncbi:hypothetical protein KVR01_000134 [Diaporthe batatas]|uniref:uncharacterized protein n=1 Tax=Diaporthe batatas TaxID=748121 RepID=UPI001D03EFF2|nr:uncharacterized protein KVR01_000134 [Diaporthe batatas]KAG8169389.1 hypothetical protein KVR01_000134 [Diaporthe batatas]